MITIDLKYGPMKIEVKQVADGWQRVATYSLINHPKYSNKVLTSKSVIYKAKRFAINEADKFALSQKGKQ